MSRRKKFAKSSGRPNLPAVFINRSLGAIQLPAALRDVGYCVTTMREMYGEQGGQNLTGDEKWIREVAARGLVIFSADNRSLCGQHKPTIIECGAKVFIVPHSNKLRGRDQIQRFVDHRFRIAMKASKPGPMIYRIYAEGLSKNLLDGQSIASATKVGSVAPG